MRLAAMITFSLTLGSTSSFAADPGKVVTVNGNKGSVAQRLYDALNTVEQYAYFHHPEARIFEKLGENMNCRKSDPESIKVMATDYSCDILVK